MHSTKLVSLKAQLPVRSPISRINVVRRQLVVRAMSGQPVYDIAVKGAKDPKTGEFILGDCPFSHRALLTLEEKKIPYTKTLIDFKDKPQWLLDANPSGGVPVLKELETGKFIPDSGVIADMLEEKFPEPALGTAESAPQVGNDLFGAFRGFLFATPEEASEKEAALVSSLKAINEYLEQNPGPYIGGENVCATDLSLAPKIYACKHALKAKKNWDIPAEFTALHKYFDAVTQRESWKNTYYSPELVVLGWSKH